MPDRVSLLVLASRLTWVNVLRLVHFLVGLREHRKHISDEVDDRGHVAADLDHDWRLESWNLDVLLLVEEGEDQLDQGACELRDQ